MSTQTTLESLRTAHASFCDDLYAKFPAQESNRARYDDFRRTAQLGKIKHEPSIKGERVLRRGTMVLFTVDAEEPSMAHVWCGPSYSAFISKDNIEPC